MMQHNREELVERYLAGQMTAAEESEFFLNVAVDDELQRTLRSYRIVENSIQSDSVAAVRDRSPYRDKVMTLLAATPAVVGATAAAAGAASSGATATSAAAGMAAWKVVLLGVIGASAVIGTAVTVGPRLLDDRSPGALPPAVERSVDPPVGPSMPGSAIAPAQGGAPSVESSASTENATRSIPDVAAPTGTRAGSGTHAVTDGAKGIDTRAGSRSTAADGSTGTSERPMLNLPPETNNDVSLRMNVERPKKQ